MSVRMFRAKIKPDRTTDLEIAGEKLFAAIADAQPEGVRYAWCKLPDNETYVLLVDLDDDADNPLAAIPAFKETMDNLKQNWVVAPLAVEQLTPIQSYRFF